MDDEEVGKGIDKFAGISEKLKAPKKVSQFEKARQEAEAKKQREDAEAERALRAFEDSFAEDDGDSGYEIASDQYGANRDGRSSLGTSRVEARPPPSLKRKRELEEMAQERGRFGSRDGGYSLGRADSGGRARNDRRFTADDDEDAFGGLSSRTAPEEKVRKPTMLLQSLPLTMTESDIHDIMPEWLKVEDVSFIRPPRGAIPELRCKSALVAASAATPASDVDKTVSQLQNQYLGFGCYLKLSRHVSAGGSLTNMDTSILSTTNRNPFGATARVEPEPQQTSLSYNRAAPPSDFKQVSSAARRGNVPIEVNVIPPSDIKLLKLIHQTAECLTNHGPDFEALLMSRREVQRDEKWAWLYDASSPGAVYYRWLLWKLQLPEGVLGEAKPQLVTDIDRLFDSGPVWRTPSSKLKFAGAMRIEDICDDPEYVSSDDDSGDEGDQRRSKDKPSGQLINIEEVGDSSFDVQSHYLNPYRRAKLTHLLARLPESMATLRSGDIARVTQFVVTNAGQGAEEIVDMLVSNVEHPFRYSVKYADEPEERLSSEDEGSTAEEIGAADANASKRKRRDRSNAQLIALYAISDVLLSSATSGVRDAWKYRNLFESAITQRHIFERLGRLEKTLSWGRMKAEQWKRKISVVLDVWNSASVFPTDIWRAMKKSFLEPPLTEEETQQKEAEAKAQRESAGKSKWKVAGAGPAQDSKESQSPANGLQAVQPAVVDDKKAEAMSKIAAMKAKLGSQAAKPKDPSPEETQQNEPTPTGRRSRMTAEDLFDAPEEPTPEPSKAELEKKAPPAPIAFSMSGNGNAGAAATPGKGPPAAFGGFSIAAAKATAPQVAVKAPARPANMFGDDSDDD